jgi:hypothetical protein
MPKGRVLETAFTWGEDRRPECLKDMVIYEMRARLHDGTPASRAPARNLRRTRLLPPS